MNAPRVSTSVVEKVAASKGVHHTELPPLAVVVDPDALDAIYATDHTGARPVVQFTYAGRHVVVRSSTDIEV
jgi:hypothetical protein